MMKAMRVRECRIVAVLVLLAYLIAAPPAHAEVFKDLATGLAYLGFDVTGNRNPLSGGIDLQVSNTFLGNELDFGPGDLTLQGPLSLSISTGGRELSEWEFALRTAPGAGGEASPIAYVLNYDAGGQSVQIDGSVLVDAQLKLNGFGFYDWELRYSSRQTVSREGRFADDSTNYDFDLGPTHVRGNVFADVLAAITEPFFQAAGQRNIFASFSGSTPRFAAGERGLAGLTDPIGVDGPLSDAELVRLANRAVLGQILGDARYPFVPGDVGDVSLVTTTGRVVPEPSVVILMLLGLPMIFRRSISRALSQH